MASSSTIKIALSHEHYLFPIYKMTATSVELHNFSGLCTMIGAVIITGFVYLISLQAIYFLSSKNSTISEPTL